MRGIDLFENMSTYLIGFKASITEITQDDWFSRIMEKTVKKLEETLIKLKEDYEIAKEGWGYFQTIHKLLWNDTSPRDDKIAKIDSFFDLIWKRSQELQPNYTKEDRKSFLPASETPYWKFNAE